MAKVKTKKHDTFIDMTAMSDVTVLLLTFFMLTASFLPLEPVQVITPASVSETKIPEYNSLTILVDGTGKVFMSFDRPEDKQAVLEKMGQDYGITFTDKQKFAFREEVSHVGVPMNMMQGLLNLDASDRNEEIRKHGIPSDSINNQLARWVQAGVAVNPDLKISIKAGMETPYPLVQKVMKTLVDIKQNRYSLITTLKTMPQGF